ncbi:MAG: hypothetical protein N4A49_06925 [Marinifilaceae bacterium]|jgi:hypothetical protein|nr:hypothetical protein [Marinifilaceae bacterium]
MTDKYNLNLESLTSKLKKEDLSYSKLCRNLQIMYCVLAPLYLIMAIMEYSSNSNSMEMFSQLSFFMAMLTLALGFNYFRKIYKNINYSEPTVKMLRSIINRYKIFSIKSWWIIPAFIFLDLALVFRKNDFESILQVQLIFLGTVILAVGVGIIVWWFKYKYLIDNAKKLLKEIES